MRLSKIFILLLTFVTLSCDNCVQKEIKVYLNFVDANNQEVQTNFDRVYGLGGKGNWNLSSTGYIPLSLSADSTLFLFERGAQVDTLLITYERHIRETASINEGYCMRLISERLKQSSFDVTCVQFGSGVMNSCGSHNYEITLRYE
ncbi:hypothetical protein [Luteibaculum oceani]|uniref:Lipoprotein n=1 Tax=Luteibaculum oceani TaxID=1294296 RepID=A0A5C6URZ2_9FLAO|nr:hypothetical protein [Luteibaculum oceani]TXC76083.1 hypothetical protein FRX97_11255 [Luteibaculum oceani]